MASDIVRIKVGVSMSSIYNSTREDVIEIPRAEWDAMTEDDRTKMLDECAEEMLSNEVEAYAYVEEVEG